MFEYKCGTYHCHLPSNPHGSAGIYGSLLPETESFLDLEKSISSSRQSPLQKIPNTDLLEDWKLSTDRQVRRYLLRRCIDIILPFHARRTSNEGWTTYAMLVGGRNAALLHNTNKVSQKQQSFPSLSREWALFISHVRWAMPCTLVQVGSHWYSL